MNSKLWFLLLVLFISFFSLPFSSLAATKLCHPDDYTTLMKIKKALNNPYHLASWVPNTDCCNWYCLECDLQNNRVNRLTIFAGQISGQIPTYVGDLPFLENLTFRKLTNITGSIPSSIVKLKNLKYLSLDNTNLSGLIPDFLGEMNSLVILDLSFNQFSGSIPPSLANLTNLGAIHLDRNRLTGSIPESFGRFRGSIPNLYLSHNQLSGPIPKSLGDVNFGIIDLSRNRLEGDASMLFNPKRLPDKNVDLSIDLSRNLFEFDLTNVSFAENLVTLDLSHNKIFGKIPASMKNLEILSSLNVSYNRLCGEIPNGGKLQSFDYSTYFHNRCLCGAPLAKCK